MVIPAGLQAATQRIREIQGHLAQLNASNPDTLDSRGGFEAILSGTLAQDSESTDAQALEALAETQADRAGMDPSLIKAVVKAESGFNPDAVSPAGAQGLMQLMPSTAQSLGVQSALDPVENLRGGTEYLKSLLTKYHTIPTALAAYNAGPGAVDKFGGIPPYPETQSYVQRVMAYQRQYQAQQGE